MVSKCENVIGVFRINKYISVLSKKDLDTCLFNHNKYKMQCFSQMMSIVLILILKLIVILKRYYDIRNVCFQSTLNTIVVYWPKRGLEVSDDENRERFKLFFSK